jgi:hypothetical protein
MVARLPRGFFDRHGLGYGLIEVSIREAEEWHRQSTVSNKVDLFSQCLLSGIEQVL